MRTLMGQPFESYSAVQLADGSYSVRSEVHQETFHPVVGSKVEARCVYFDPMRLEQRWGPRCKELCVWDVGLGSAGNALHLMRAHEKTPRKLRLHSFDKTLGGLRFALDHAEKFPYLHGFERSIILCLLSLVSFLFVFVCSGVGGLYFRLCFQICSGLAFRSFQIIL